MLLARGEIIGIDFEGDHRLLRSADVGGRHAQPRGIALHPAVDPFLGLGAQNHLPLDRLARLAG